MKELIKYSGVIIVLIAVLVLAIPHFMGIAISSNGILITAFVLLIVGLFVYIYTNKKFK